VRRGALLAVALAAALSVAPPSAPAAQEEAARIRLASRTPWVGPGQAFVLRLLVDGTVDKGDAELAVSVFRRVASRSEFALTLDDRLRGSPLNVTATALTALTPDAAGALLVELPVQDPLQLPDPARLRLREEGVYPVRVELRRTGGGPTLARLVTHLVYASAPQEGGEKLRVALVVPVHAPPALLPDRAGRAVTDGELSRLAGVAAAVEAHPDVPVTLKPTPETLQALAADDRGRETVEALERSLPGRQVAGSTYVPVSPPMFADDDLAAEAAAQQDRGAAVLDELLGVKPDARTALVDDLDDPSLQRLREQQVDRLVVPDATLTPADLPVTLAQPFELETRQVRRPTAVAADGALAAHFAAPDDPVLGAHHLLADLAVLYFDRPGRSRGVVAVPARDVVSRAVLDPVLAGLGTSPIVAGTTVDALFDRVPPATTPRGDTLRRAPLPARPVPAAVALPTDRLREARARLQSFAAMLDSDNLLDDEIEELLLVSQSVELRGRGRTAYIDGAERRIAEQLGLLRVPVGRTITLTARRGEIPVTVLNEANYRVHLDIRVASDKLGFPQGAVRRVELTRRNTTERFSVDARTSGAFPLRVTLVSPDGRLVVGESRFTVRSTAFSGVGLVLSAGALVVLLAWWARHHVRGRRNRRLVSS
jgi:hypothetical protein